MNFIIFLLLDHISFPFQSAFQNRTITGPSSENLTFKTLLPFSIACSFFIRLVPFRTKLVPFLPPKGTTLTSSLCLFLSFSLPACVFFYLPCVFFYPKPLSKKTQPSVSIPLTLHAFFYAFQKLRVSDFA